MKAIKFRLAILISVISFLLIAGTIGFMALEKLNFIDAVYFTIVTISTVGYGDIHASTLGGKILAVVLIVVGVGVFLGLIADATQLVLRSREERIRQQRINVLISVFFSEIGTELLRMFSILDPNITRLREDTLVTSEWSDQDFINLNTRLESHDYSVDPQRIDLNPLTAYLSEKGSSLTQLLENPNLQEHESFTNTILALFHLKDELLARRGRQNLPETDLDHLANDIKRVYILLTGQWVGYMRYLKRSYPYLFSLALRTNPFSEEITPVVE